MPLSKLNFKPGINKEETDYANEGGWVDGDKIRFRKGRVEKIGGWEKISSNTIIGSVRALHSWISLGGSKYLGLGTTGFVSCLIPILKILFNIMCSSDPNLYVLLIDLLNLFIFHLYSLFLNDFHILMKQAP